MSVLATLSRPGPDEPALLERFGIDATALLGAGGESRVFALDADRVLRVFNGRADPAVIDLLDRWRDVDLGVLVPRVLERGRERVQDWTIDARMPGESLAVWLARPQPEPRRRAMLRDYLDVAARLRALPLPGGGFRALFVPDAVGPGAGLVDLLRERAAHGMAHNDRLLATELPDVDARAERLYAELAVREGAPAFVHNDYFPGNVMVDGERVTGVLDVSVHALAADPVMDEVAAACFVEHVDYPQAAADAAWLCGVLEQRLGVDGWLVGAYRRWYALYYSMDDALVGWSARQLLDDASSSRSSFGGAVIR